MILNATTRNPRTSQDGLACEDAGLGASGIFAPIAFQCPFEGGHAVYRARALYLLNERAAFDDVQLCQNGTGRPAGQPGATLPAGPAEDFRLFPNPARDSWRLGVPQAYIGQPMSIRIYSLAGQLAGGREVRAAAPFEPMEGRLESGLYFVEAWSGGQRVFIGRLAIMN
jgi:hypothetical protein